MIEGCGSWASDVTIFHSFQLCNVRDRDMKRLMRCAYSDWTRALVVAVFDLCTSLVATLTSLGVPGATPLTGVRYGRQSQTLPQLPKPI